LYIAPAVWGAEVRAVLAGLCAIVIVGADVASAVEPLAAPAGPVILTISGSIDEAAAAGEARFDGAMLESLGVTTLRTSTAWTDGVKTFEGVPLRKVLARVGARGSRLHAEALNDYRVAIPFSDLRYNPLLAMRMNGQPLTLRARGPLWIVFPRDTYPALRNSKQDSHWVWQLSRLRVE
jgi:hypothetical protein